MRGERKKKEKLQDNMHPLSPPPTPYYKSTTPAYPIPPQFICVMFPVMVICSLLFMLHGQITRVNMLYQLLFGLYHIVHTVRIVTCNSNILGCGWGDKGWVSSYNFYFFLVLLYFVASRSQSLYLGG